MKAHARQGRKVCFPEVNLPRDQSFEHQDTFSDEQKKELPSERSIKTQKNSEEIIQELTENNRRLLASSNNWYKKYQDLLWQRESSDKTQLYATPQTLTKTDFDNAFSF